MSDEDLVKRGDMRRELARFINCNATLIDKWVATHIDIVVDLVPPAHPEEKIEMEQNYEHYIIRIRDGKDELIHGISGLEASYEAYLAAVNLMEKLGAMETGYVDLYADNGGTLECIKSTIS